MCYLPAYKTVTTLGAVSLIILLKDCWEISGLGIHTDVTLTQPTHFNIVTDQVPPTQTQQLHFQTTAASPQRCLGMVWGMLARGGNNLKVMVSKLLRNLKKQLQGASWTGRKHEGPPNEPKHLKDLLPSSWCQTPQDTPRGSVVRGQSCFGMWL